MKKLTAIVMGYGMRGQAYASYAVDHPDDLEIVAVAEAETSRREYAKKRTLQMMQCMMIGKS